MKRYSKKLIFLATDVFLILLSFYIAMFFRFDGAIPELFIGLLLRTCIFIVSTKLIFFYVFGLYRSLWRYASIGEVLQILFAVIFSIMFDYITGSIFGTRLPRTVYAIAGLLLMMFIGGSRFSFRVFTRIINFNPLNKSECKNVMIIGAGAASSIVIKELRNNEELNHMPIIVIDDDWQKHGSLIHGIPIIGGREQIIEASRKYNIDEIIVAIPSAKKEDIRDILNICKNTNCKLKKLPGVYEIINEKVSIKNIRDVDIEDLLGRDEVTLNIEKISGFLKNEVVMVTGGGGSIGSELCRQIAKFKPEKLILFDIYENGVYDLQNELCHLYKDKLKLEVIIGSVRDKDRLEYIFSKYRPKVVFHAAAHKHVPLMEENPLEAIKNNVFGTLNVAEIAAKYHVKKFVLISTDKAVNPTNIMGATKRIAEMIIQSMLTQSETEFVAVRFGNVLGSNGSVIPLFKRQIANGGPVTVTDPEITRYFMTIPEAAQLVIQAGAMAKGGEIFVLDMGEPVKIADLAKDLIRLSGFEPGVDIKIEYTGLRPGEKLYEELLLLEEGIQKTDHNKIYVAKPVLIDTIAFGNEIEKLRSVLSEEGCDVVKVVGKIVKTYKAVS